MALYAPPDEFGSIFFLVQFCLPGPFNIPLVRTLCSFFRAVQDHADSAGAIKHRHCFCTAMQMERIGSRCIQKSCCLARCQKASTAARQAQYGSPSLPSPIFDVIIAPFSCCWKRSRETMPLSCSSRKPPYDRDRHFYRRTDCMDSSKRIISTQFISCHQSWVRVSACSAIFNANRSSCSAHFFTSFSSTTFRADRSKYQHEHSADCQGVGASTTMQNQLSFRGPKVLLFLPQYAYPTP